MLAISQAFREMTKNNANADAEPMDGKRLLVLSLGTGLPKLEEKYNAAKASKWGLLNWVFNNGNTPLIDIFYDASADVVDFLVSTLFQSRHHQKNYLRIQVFNFYFCLILRYVTDFSSLSFKKKIFCIFLDIVHCHI